ncbi:molybdate ABC transporter substrate-binding protein [Flammeovirga sp. MY04]|uniref:molybdate ABC transporter substrate-binding protein n=1 Tax=Flammeovirga sp. MY04 TaxID=1191459 RepID=UPI000826BB69|nr:molybdate ABC transporter substrate-binding protein [Flammeovirga sp. MY04]ANQ48082.2 molybdate ABC transporter substrate-binding protein [Flammeovirga sp. MY04]
MNRLYNIFLIITLFLSSCQSKEQPLRVAVSANMAFVMKDLSAEFTKKYNIPCELIIGSSGKLSHQIENGAPYDVFISADMKYPNHIYEKNLTTSPPKIYAEGVLVLWSKKLKSFHSEDILNSDQVEKIAVANPKTAPYGIAATMACSEILSKRNYQKKLVYGESISQVNQYVINQATDIGFTSLFVVQSPEMKDIGFWLKVNPSLYRPIYQGAVVIKDNNEELGERFLNWLLHEEGKDIINTYNQRD